MPLRKLNTNSQDLNLVQQNVELAIRPLEASPLTGGNLITDIQLEAAFSNMVAHGLQAVPTKWMIVRIDEDANVWEVEADDKYLTLACSADCVVSIWVAQ